MGNHQYHHLSSFNPACCFRTPQTKENTPRSPKGSAASSNSSSCSHAKSSRGHRSSNFFEPASPRVGCMGRIKRDKTFSSSSGSSSASSIRGASKLTKIKRMLSGQKMRPSSVVDVANLDRPLPVVKQPSRDAKSLWKRRCGGDSLKHIELRQHEAAAALPLRRLKS